MTDYELKLGGGRVVTWTGHDGVSAAQAYANAHPDVTVFAWRETRRHDFFPLPMVGNRIVQGKDGQS